MFNDDWDAAIPLYPFADAAATSTIPSSLKRQNQNQHQNRNRKPHKRKFKPPITLLVVSVGENIFFDPSSEELAVADAVVAISVGQVFPDTSVTSPNNPNNPKDVTRAIDAGEGKGQESGLRLLAIRTIDPPSRHFASTTTTTSTSTATTTVAETQGERGEKGQRQAPEEKRGQGQKEAQEQEQGSEEGVWKKKMGGMKRGLVSRILKMILEGGVGADVFRGLESWA